MRVRVRLDSFSWEATQEVAFQAFIVERTEKWCVHSGYIYIYIYNIHNIYIYNIIPSFKEREEENRAKGWRRE